MWKRAASRRPDMAGIQLGIDRRATLSLMSGGDISARQKGVLRGIIAGSIWTARRLFKAGRVEASNCPYCGTDAEEDIEHRFWFCSRWDSIRAGFPDVMSWDRRMWSSCLKSCGIAHEVSEVIDLGLRAGVAEDGFPEPLLPAAPPVRPFGIAEFHTVVFIAGSCLHEEDSRFRTAGWGVCWNRRGGRDASEFLVGVTQTAERACLRAAVHALEGDVGRLEIRTQCGYAVGVMDQALSGEVADEGPVGPDKDLFGRLRRALGQRNAEDILVTRVRRGSPTRFAAARHIPQEDRQGVRKARELSRRGARSRPGLQPAMDKAKTNAEATERIQRMSPPRYLRGQVVF